jgi:putative transposase
MTIKIDFLNPFLQVKRRMIRYRAFKTRIYPNQAQMEFINKTLGCSRFIYNQMLAERKQYYEEHKNEENFWNHKYKTEKQYKEEFPFLEEVDSVALVKARMNLGAAYQNFFKHQFGFPAFKRRKIGCSYNTTAASIKVDFENKKIKLPKMDWISFKNKKASFEGVIKSATISRTPTGKYCCSVLYEQEIEEPIKVQINDENQVVGLDMSLSSFFIDSDGNSPAYERLYRNNEGRIKFLQRKLSKKQRGSNRYLAHLKKISRVYEVISFKRTEFARLTALDLLRRFDCIVVEDLNMKALTQCLRLGKSIMDLGYSNFIRFLTYKAEEQGKTIVKADKWFASSKTCSHCGFVKKDLKLADREWFCPSCGTHHDRDKNAAINLKQYVRLQRPEVTGAEFKIPELFSQKSKSNFNVETSNHSSLAD